MTKDTFSLDISKFAELTEKKARQVIGASFFGLSSDIIESTPVDSGRARNNWLPSINKPDSTSFLAKGKRMVKNKARLTETANKFELGDTLFLTNNLDYIRDLEFGLYPSPSRTGKTFGGYSTQAPQGMVRLNVMRWKKIVDENTRIVKNKKY